MTKLTDQQIFDKALFGIRGQGYRQSIARYGGFMYQSISDDCMPLACAVGHCLSQEDREEWDLLGESMGKSSVSAIFRHSPESFDKYFERAQFGLLEDLQVVHDNPDFSYGIWELAMAELADKHGLHYTPVQAQGE